MIARFNGNVVPFADDATSTNRTVFGGVTQSDAIDDNLNADFKKGWEIVGLNDNPTREDFNAMGYTLSALTAYLYEMGISEWNASQKYRTNSRVTGSDGKIYKSLTGTTVIPNVNHNPTSDAVNWELEFKNFVTLTGNQTIAGVKTFSSSPIVPTPTTDFQSVPLKSTNITVNVGTGQTYTTINQALEYLSGFYPMYKKSGVTATINLKAGFVMAEQVLVSGIDLGWITIVGEDAETIITHTALTTGFNGTHYPAFGVDKSGTSPVIGQLFRFNVEKVGGGKHGLMAYGAGSSADVLSGKGFIGAGSNGAYALNCSTINANGANCSSAGVYGVLALDCSAINANGANCSSAGAHGVNAGGTSTINANGAIVQNQTTGSARIRVGEGSYIVAVGINTTGGTVPVFSQAINILTTQGIIYQ